VVTELIVSAPVPMFENEAVARANAAAGRSQKNEIRRYWPRLL
jgi:hypothetical protein